MAALANENTRLIGAFHDDAPATLNSLSKTGWVLGLKWPTVNVLSDLPPNRPRGLGVIDIVDHRPGIPREKLNSLFPAFRSKQRDDTGLRLVIVRDREVAEGDALKFTRSTENGNEFRLQFLIEMYTSGK